MSYDPFRNYRFTNNRKRYPNWFEYFDMIDVEIFEYIMFLFRKDIEPVYPKAYENLKYKLFI